VFGAGPAGTSVAMRLADLGVAAIVLDRPPKTKPWGGESFTGAIRQPLSALGLWEDFRAAGYVAGYEQRTAWGAGSWIQSTIFRHHGNLWHVDRNRFDNDLREAVRQRGISILAYRSLRGCLKSRRLKH
jgi:flavin-dependent dehydrogenase